MKGFKLLGFSYSPGYSDMRGGSHSVSLVQDKDGVWTMTCRDRESYGSPTSVAVYSVPEGSVGVFEIFLEKSRVLSLEKRPKSTVFATDYSPWSYSADYEKTVFGKTKRYQCRTPAVPHRRFQCLLLALQIRGTRKPPSRHDM